MVNQARRLRRARGAHSVERVGSIGSAPGARRARKASNTQRGGAAWLSWQAWLGALLAASMLLALGVSGLSGIVMPRAQAQEQPSAGANPNSAPSTSSSSSTTPSTPTTPDARIVNPDVLSVTQSTPTMISGNGDPTDDITVVYGACQGGVITIQSPQQGNNIWSWGGNGNNATIAVPNSTISSNNGVTQIVLNSNQSGRFSFQVRPHMNLSASLTSRLGDLTQLQPGEHTFKISLQCGASTYKADTTFNVQPDTITTADSWSLNTGNVPRSQDGTLLVLPHNVYQFGLWNGFGWMQGENFAPNSQKEQHYTWDQTKMVVDVPGGFELIPPTSTEAVKSGPGFSQPGGPGTPVIIEPSHDWYKGSIVGRFTQLPACSPEKLEELRIALVQGGNIPTSPCPKDTAQLPSTMSAYFGYETKPRTIPMKDPLSVALGVAIPRGDAGIGGDNVIPIPTKSALLRPDQNFNYQYTGSYATHADSAPLYNVTQELPTPDGSNEVGLAITWNNAQPNESVTVVATRQDGSQQTFTKTFVKSDIDSSNNVTFTLPIYRDPQDPTQSQIPAPDKLDNPYVNFKVVYSKLDPNSHVYAQVTAQSKATFTDGSAVPDLAKKQERQTVTAWTDPSPASDAQPAFSAVSAAQVQYVEGLENGNTSLVISSSQGSIRSPYAGGGQWKDRYTFKIGDRTVIDPQTNKPKLDKNGQIEQEPPIIVSNTWNWGGVGAQNTTEKLFEPVVSFLLPATARYQGYELPQGAPKPRVTEREIQGSYLEAFNDVSTYLPAKQRVVTFDWSGTGYWASLDNGGENTWPTVRWSPPARGVNGVTQIGIFVSTKNDPQVQLTSFWNSDQSATAFNTNGAIKYGGASSADQAAQSGKPTIRSIIVNNVTQDDTHMKLLGSMDVLFTSSGAFGSDSEIINNQGAQSKYAINSLNKGNNHELVTIFNDTNKTNSVSGTKFYQFTSIPQASVGADGKPTSLQVQVASAGHVEDALGNTLPDSVAQIYYCMSTHDVKSITADAQVAAMIASGDCKTAAQMGADDWAKVKSVVTLITAQTKPSVYYTRIPLVAPNAPDHLGEVAVFDTVGVAGYKPLYSYVRDTFVNLAGVKSWQNPDGTTAEAPKDASVVVGLYKAVQGQGADGAWTADGGNAAQPVASVTLNAANGWAFDFATMPNVPLVDATTQQPIRYIVKEQNVPEGYQAIYQGCEASGGVVKPEPKPQPNPQLNPQLKPEPQPKPQTEPTPPPAPSPYPGWWGFGGSSSDSVSSTLFAASSTMLMSMLTASLQDTGDASAGANGVTPAAGGLAGESSTGAGVASTIGFTGSVVAASAVSGAKCGAQPFKNDIVNRKVSLAVSMLPMTGAAQSHAWLATLVLVVLGAAGMMLFGSLGFGLRRLGVRGSGARGLGVSSFGSLSFLAQAKHRKRGVKRAAGRHASII